MNREQLINKLENELIQLKKIRKECIDNNSLKLQYQCEGAFKAIQDIIIYIKELKC